MTQTTIDFSGDPTGVELLDDLLAPLQHNLLTSHAGTSRPSYAEAGTEWIDTTSNPWVLKRFDGTDDIIVGFIDTTANTYTPAGLILDKLNATIAPTINDDNADGYSVGSKWIDTTADLAYIAVDVSTGAAVWKEIGGSLTGPSSSVDSEIAIFSGTTGKVIKRATGTGFAKLTSGVLSSVSNIALTDLANQAANSITANNTNISGPPATVSLAVNQMLGRGASGNLAAIALGTNLSMSGTTLNAADQPDGSSSVKGIVKVDGTTITASGGVISAVPSLMTPFNIGSIILAKCGTNVSANSTVIASALVVSCFNTAGTTLVATGDTISGSTWKALQSINTNQHGLFQRIS